MLRRGEAKSAIVGIAAIGAVFTCLAASACQPNPSILNSSQTPAPTAELEPRKTDLETDIRDMGTAGLDYVFVVRRKDGALFDKEDRRFLRENMPVEINRRVSADDGKAFVLGTSFPVPQETVRKWRERFLVEERKKPVPEGEKGK